MSDKMNIICIDEASCEADDEGYIEGVAWSVQDLFDECGIRMASYDEPVFGIEVAGNLVAALVGGAPCGDPWSGMRFSVCVAKDHRNNGYARALIEKFIKLCGADGFPVEAWVVNEEAMNPLLEDLGFTADGPIWSY